MYFPAQIFDYRKRFSLLATVAAMKLMNVRGKYTLEQTLLLLC